MFFIVLMFVCVISFWLSVTWAYQGKHSWQPTTFNQLQGEFLEVSGSEKLHSINKLFNAIDHWPQERLNSLLLSCSVEGYNQEAFLSHLAHFILRGWADNWTVLKMLMMSILHKELDTWMESLWWNNAGHSPRDTFTLFSTRSVFEWGLYEPPEVVKVWRREGWW